MSNVTVKMLGTGCPRPEIERAGPAQVLLIDNLPILIDCGEGTTAQLMKAGIAPEEVKHLYFTHLHSDHTMGYTQFLFAGWELGRRQLTVVGPKGLKKYHDTIVGMFEEDIDYRLSLGRPRNGLLDVNIVELEGKGEVSCDIPARVTAAQMDHSILTYAYRFDIQDTSVVISGDTAPTNALVELSKDADILVHDCCLAPTKLYTAEERERNPERQALWKRINETHCTPAQAAETARQANVKQLVLTHFLPDIDVQKTYEEATEVFSGKVIVPNDLEVITAKNLSGALT